MADQLNDGNYTVEVTLGGGSGRASVKSPAALTVENGKMTAEIEWSSNNYDYMSVSGTDYYPVNTEGNSRFWIEIPALDEEIPVSAETLAMSQPHLIDYTLYFDAATVRSTEKAPWGAAIGVICAVGLAACAAALLWKKTARSGGKSHE